MYPMEEAKKFVRRENFIEQVEYEDLCSDPVGAFEKVVMFCELRWSADFVDSVKKYTSRNTN